MAEARDPVPCDALSMARVLADPSVSFALKAVIRRWSSRDCVDAANDAAVLCRLFEDEADRRLGRAR